MSEVKTIKRIVNEPDRLFTVSLPENNPYDSGTPAWHCFIDVSCSMGSNVNAANKVSMAVMLMEHEQSIEYYETYLGQLIEDGFLKELQNEK